MCIKKIWNFFFPQPDPVPVPDPIPTPDPNPTPKKKIALLFGINDYPGNVNDLRGCLNDIDDVATKLNREFPGFVITKFKDAEVTCARFYYEIKTILLLMKYGDILYVHYSGHGTQVPSSQEANGYHEALYLYDGPFIDDKVQELQAMTVNGAIVVAKFDSCFSGDMLREFTSNPSYIKNKFYQMPGVPLMHKVVKRFAKAPKLILKWVVFSGCSEEQTSSDAEFNGRANGAFTYFDNLSYNAKSSYSGEIVKLHTYLPGDGFDQDPTIDGDANLFNHVVFE
jgi:hypothetical protein